MPELSNSHYEGYETRSKLMLHVKANLLELQRGPSCAPLLPSPGVASGIRSTTRSSTPMCPPTPDPPIHPASTVSTRPGGGLMCGSCGPGQAWRDPVRGGQQRRQPKGWPNPSSCIRWCSSCWDLRSSNRAAVPWPWVAVQLHQFVVGLLVVHQVLIVHRQVCCLGMDNRVCVVACAMCMCIRQVYHSSMHTVAACRNN